MIGHDPLLLLIGRRLRQALDVGVEQGQQQLPLVGRQLGCREAIDSGGEGEGVGVLGGQPQLLGHHLLGPVHPLVQPILQPTRPHGGQ